MHVCACVHACVCVSCVCVGGGGGTGMNVSKQQYHFSWFNGRRSNPNTLPVLLFVCFCCKERAEHDLQQWHSHIQSYAVKKSSFDNQAASLRVNTCLCDSSKLSHQLYLSAMCFLLEFRFEEACILDMTFHYNSGHNLGVSWLHHGVGLMCSLLDCFVLYIYMLHTIFNEQ